MRKKMAAGILFAVACSMALLAGLLTGCGGSGNGNGGKVEKHEPITIVSAFRNISDFKALVEEKYPEIDLEVVPYSGANFTAYTKASLRADDTTDIFFSTVYSPTVDDYSTDFIDLSGYDFTDSYADSRLQDVTTSDGSIYALPTYYDCLGITYNKTLLDKHGWKLPTNFKELKELAAKAKKAGVRLSIVQDALPGYGFQYWCNILDTNFLNTPEGRAWQSDFINGETNISKSSQAKEAMKALDEWREIGMLSDKTEWKSVDEARQEMAKGNTLFMLGSGNVFSDESTKDEFGLMPYLSEDGNSNAYILNFSRFVSLSKHLQDPGNEQKLEDAVHVMEVLSSVEGMSTLNSALLDTCLLPLKDYTPSETSFYADILDDLNAGKTAPFIYSGWEDAIVPIGNAGIDFIRGKKSLSEFEKAIDKSQKYLKDNSDNVFATVTEKFDTDASARLVGFAFAKAAGCDVALISENKYFDYGNTDDLNLEGVSGALFAGPVTDQELTSITPTGWTGNIQTVKLTGKRIKELAESGYDRKGDGNCYPYQLVDTTTSGIDDDTTYKVAIAGVTDDVAKEGKAKDSGVLGLQAMRDYVSKLGTLSLQNLFVD